MAVSTVSYTYTAGEDIDPGQAVQLDPANPGEVLICTDGSTGAGQVIAGISAHGAKSGESIDAVKIGEVYSKSGAAIASTAQKLTVDVANPGYLVAAATGDQVIAHMVGNIGTVGADELIKVFVVPAYDAV